MTIQTDSLHWRCACGCRPWLHYEHCPDCGTQRPEPAPEPPTDTPIVEHDPA